MEKAEGFEIAEYSGEPPLDQKYSVLEQILQDRHNEGPNNPSENIRMKFTGDMLQLFFHCYEVGLPYKIKEIEVRADDALNDALKYLKKEYKVRTSRALSVTEKKELRNTSAQKASLNERYYYLSWRFYELK